jgi:cell division cycle protein 37
MMQRNIHEKRDERNRKIATLEAQIACNNVLLPRITEIANNLASGTSEPATVYFNNLISKLRANPSKDCPPGNDPNKLEHTYDGMLLSLLNMVTEKAKQRVQDAGLVGDAEKKERLEKELQAEMKMHVKQLTETIEKDQQELDHEEAEKRKKITMDDIHEGFDSKVSHNTVFYRLYLIHHLSTFRLNQNLHLYQ